MVLLRDLYGYYLTSRLFTIDSLSLFSVSLWLLWCVFFFGLAWFLNHFYRRQVEKMNYCSPGGFFCKCVDERCVAGHRKGVSDADSDDDGEEKDKLLSKLMV